MVPGAGYTENNNQRGCFMSVVNIMARWAVATRWIAYLGIGVVLALSYSALRPATAQEKAKVPTPPGKAAATDAPPADPRAASKTGLEKAVELAKEAEAKPEEKKDKPAESEDEESRKIDYLRIILEAGPHMWAVWTILVVSIVTVCFAIERAIGLRRSKVVPAELMAALRALTSQRTGFDPRQAYRLCRQYPSSAATVVKTMLQKVGRPMPELEHTVAEVSDREASRLFANVRWQNLAFNVAPMLGLAGTIHGMILAFFAFSQQTASHAQTQQLGSTLGKGVYAALICTLAGLLVAIPAGVLAHVFEGADPQALPRDRRCGTRHAPAPGAIRGPAARHQDRPARDRPAHDRVGTGRDDRRPEGQVACHQPRRSVASRRTLSWPSRSRRAMR
jgi:biopolymer transport protein ExbB